MTHSYLQHLLLLYKRLMAAYAAYFLCRLMFFTANINYFQDINVFTFLKDCILGLRFDTFSIVAASSPFILMSILPVNTFQKKGYQRLLKWLFIIPNSIFILINCIDTGYFHFTKKRAVADLFEQMKGQSDLTKLLPRFIVDFWWVSVWYILIVFVLIFIYKRFKINFKSDYIQTSIKSWTIIVLLFILTVGGAILGIRGGFQRIPVDIVNAGSMAGSAEDIPIILNTPFTLIKSASMSSLPELNFYSENELRKIYNPIHQFKDSVFRKENVVVIILESFSKEYTKLGRTQKSLTPFLDSLMSKSLVFSNAFSNGTKSIEGIPAILSSLPSLMSNPFINSIYANNKQTSFASILNEEGYETAFFHGGINGTMNFDNWSPLAGYQHYFGRNEYNNEADFDGYWGIWDEAFLQYATKKMNEMKQPFHSAIFTLSSHHPFFIPEKYKNKFPSTKLENSKSIGYADYALRKFFIAAKKTEWYKNTIFILTADHASISNHPFYSNIVGNLSIPILFFRPDNSLTGENKSVLSQMDILPSTLNLLGYNKPFFSFGESFLSNNPHHCFYYADGNYFLYEDSTLFSFNGSELKAVYNYRRDSVLNKNIINDHPYIDSSAILKFKTFIQTYNNSLIRNSGNGKSGNRVR